MTNIDTAARRLRDAYSGAPLSPMRDVMEGTDGSTAYAIQSANTLFWKKQGRRIIGRKIGLTARAVQMQLGVDRPDYGTLFDDMAIADGGVLDPTRVIQPKVEAEIALILGQDLPGEDCDAETVLIATESAVAALEVVDSRIADWKITFADTVADNGSSAFFVLGQDRLPVDGLDLFTCGMAMEVNDDIVSVGAGAACLGHPLKAAAWLAATLARAGDPLRAGDILLTGALGPMVAIHPGDEIRASIGGLGVVSFRYGDKR